MGNSIRFESFTFLVCVCARVSIGQTAMGQYNKGTGNKRARVLTDRFSEPHWITYMYVCVVPMWQEAD